MPEAAVTDLDNDMLGPYATGTIWMRRTRFQSDDLTQEDGSASCKVTDLTVFHHQKDDDLQVAVPGEGSEGMKT